MRAMHWINHAWVSTETVWAAQFSHACIVCSMYYYLYMPGFAGPSLQAMALRPTAQSRVHTGCPDRFNTMFTMPICFCSQTSHLHSTQYNGCMIYVVSVLPIGMQHCIVHIL